MTVKHVKKELKRKSLNRMRLRSGKIIQYRIFKSVKMTPPAGSQATTTVITARAGVTPFAGRENGVLKQSVECFISSIDSLIASKGLTDPALILNEAKSFFDFSKGDLGAWSRSLSFARCTTWDGLKTELRKIYGTYSEVGLVRDLSEILRLADRGGESMITNNARINDRLIEFINKIRGSDWVTGDTISLDNFQILLQLGLNLASLPPALVNCFDEKLDNHSTETSIMELIRKHRGKLPNFDNTIVDGKVKTKNRQDIESVNYVGPKTYQGNNVHGPAITCNNCKKKGHIARDCNTHYCGRHNTTGHSYRNCNSRQPAEQGRHNPPNRRQYNNRSNFSQGTMGHWNNSQNNGWRGHQGNSNNSNNDQVQNHARSDNVNNQRLESRARSPTPAPSRNFQSETRTKGNK